MKYGALWSLSTKDMKTRISEGTWGNKELISRTNWCLKNKFLILKKQINSNRFASLNDVLKISFLWRPNRIKDQVTTAYQTQSQTQIWYRASEDWQGVSYKRQRSFLKALMESHGWINSIICFNIFIKLLATSVWNLIEQRSVWRYVRNFQEQANFRKRLNFFMNK